MTHATATPLPIPCELDREATMRVGGGFPGHGGMDTPYWATDGSMRFGAGPWDYGYGSPTGPWPA